MANEKGNPEEVGEFSRRGSLSSRRQGTIRPERDITRWYIRSVRVPLLAEEEIPSASERTAGNKSKMDFSRLLLVARSDERKHLPVYSRLAVCRQPSSSHLPAVLCHESCRRLPSYAHTCYTRVSVCLRPRNTRAGSYFHAGNHLSGSNPRPTSSIALRPLVFARKKDMGEDQKVFLQRNTYLRASIFSTCTWNTGNSGRSKERLLTFTSKRRGRIVLTSRQFLDLVLCEFPFVFMARFFINCARFHFPR